MTNKSVSIVFSVAASFTGFAAGSTHAQTLDVDYGVVTKASKVSAGGGRAVGTGIGALAGGVIGYTVGKGSSTGKKIRGILAGTAGGGLIGNQAAKEHNKGAADGGKVNEYVVELLDGGSVTITTEQDRIDVDDCVAVARGESANIRRVSQVHCRSKSSEPTKEHLAEAEECEAAKAAMLEADGDEALAAAVRKARLRCEE